MAGYNTPFINPNYYGTQQPMFPQPNGNVYVISNSLEVANVPAGAGLTAAICQAENLLYLKTVQNGVPTFLAYKLSPYTDSPKTVLHQETSDNEVRLAAMEKQIAAILTMLGGKRNDESTVPVSIPTTTATAQSSDWG